MSTKAKKPQTPWFKCEKCSTNLMHRDIEAHTGDCPPNFADFKYGFVKDDTLYGTVDVKANEDVKSLAQFEKDNAVFLSQSAIQLCSLCIGEKAVVTFPNTTITPVTRTVWPTAEKLLTSVLLTKNGLSSLKVAPNSVACVTKAPEDAEEAAKITLVLLNGPAGLEITSEIANRLKKLYLNRLLTKGNELDVMYYGKVLKFAVELIETRGCADLSEKLNSLSLDCVFYKVAEGTKWVLFKDKTDYDKKTTAKLPALGGLSKETDEMKHLIEVALLRKKCEFNLDKGVLIYGSSGTGKTLFAKILAKDYEAVNVCFITPFDVVTNNSENSETNFKRLFENAIGQGAGLVIFDEIDNLCPAKPTRSGDAEKRFTAAVISVLDEIQTLPIFVLATTNKIDNVDVSLRKPGRFGREIEFPAPNPRARFEILAKMLEEIPNTLTMKEVEEISFNTHGFVGADLFALISRASLIASKRQASVLSYDDLKASTTYIKPSAMREVQIEVANVKWDDIGGQEKLKLILRQAVEWPLKHPESFKRLGVTPPRGVLMYGPPGCSKTMIAKALATETRLNFLSIKGPELFSKWVGESERAVREVFRKARQVAPSIIFFDEIDALGCERTSNSSASVQERVLAQLLTELDGVSPLGDVTVVAATNRPDRIDRALTRPGRLDRIVHVPLPSEETRREIFRIKIKKMATNNVEVEQLVSQTHGYSGAEINAICHEAAMMALEENIDALEVEMRHFLKALELIKPRTSPSLLKIYQDYAANIS